MIYGLRRNHNVYYEAFRTDWLQKQNIKTFEMRLKWYFEETL